MVDNKVVKYKHDSNLYANGAIQLLENCDKNNSSIVP
jgi:hypothetical protein